jgi:hypothetical protein
MPDTAGLRHIVLLTLDAAADLDAIEGALVALPAEIPVIRAVRVSRDVGLAEGNASLVLTVDVDDAEAWRAYQDHPAHQRVLRELLRPVLVARTAIQVPID